MKTLLSKILLSFLSLILSFLIGLSPSQSHARGWNSQDKLEQLCNAWDAPSDFGVRFNRLMMVDIVGPDLLDFGKLGWLVLSPGNAANWNHLKRLFDQKGMTSRFYALLGQGTSRESQEVLEKCLPNRKASQEHFILTLQSWSYMLTVSLIAVTGVIIWKGGAALGPNPLVFLRLLLGLISKGGSKALGTSGLIPMFNMAMAKAAMDLSGKSTPYVFRVLHHLANMAGWKQFVLWMGPIVAIASSSFAGQKNPLMEAGGKQIADVAAESWKVAVEVDDFFSVTELGQELREYLQTKLRARSRLTWREASYVQTSYLNPEQGGLFDEEDRFYAHQQQENIIHSKIRNRQCMSQEEINFALKEMNFGSYENLMKSYRTQKQNDVALEEFLSRSMAVDPMMVMTKVRTQESLTEREKDFLRRTLPATHYSSSDLALIQGALEVKTRLTEKSIAAIRLKVNSLQQPISYGEAKALVKRVGTNQLTDQEKTAVLARLVARIEKKEISP